MDINGLADPFCKLNILPNAKMSTRLRTKTVHKTRNPEFNEKLTFYDIRESDLMKKSLHILVVDDDKYGHDYMGETRIPLAKLWMQNSIYAVKSHPTDVGIEIEIVCSIISFFFVVNPSFGKSKTRTEGACP